jgi:hypothetical protein
LLGAVATYRLEHRRLFAAGDLGLVGTFTRAAGSGYESNRSASTTNLGGLAGAHCGIRLGRFRVSVDARALRLARAETVKVTSSSPGIGDSAGLDAWDLQVGAGVGFRFD